MWNTGFLISILNTMPNSHPCFSFKFYLCSFKNVFIDFHSVWKAERQRQSSSVHRFMSQMPIAAGAGTGRSQEPRTQYWPPPWVTVTQFPNITCYFSECTLADSWNQKQVQDLNPSSPVWNADISTGVLTTRSNESLAL